MASIHSRIRKDGSTAYRVAFRINGNQAQESFDDPASAERFKLLVERVGGRSAREILLEQEGVTVGAPTLSEWMERYLDPDSGLLTGIAKDTRAKYREIAERSFLQRLGDVPLTSIKDSSVRAWVNWQAEQPSSRNPDQCIAAKTIANYHGLLSAALGAAVGQKILDANPAYGVELPKGRRRAITFLTEKEFATLYEAIPPFYRRMALALAGSGLRFGELSALTWADLVEVDDGWCFDVNKAWKDGANSKRWIGQPKSEAGIRLVSISQDVVDALGPRMRSEELIFKSSRGNPISSSTFAAMGLHRAVKDLGFPRRPRVHDLRHSHASWLIARNVPLPYIQRRLGHEKIDTTIQVYGHLLPEALSATRSAATDAIKAALELGKE